MKLVWRNRHLTIGTPSVTTASGVNSTTGSYDNLNEKPVTTHTRDASAKVTDAAAAIALAEKEKLAPRTRWNFGWKLSAKKENEEKADEDSDAEKGATPKPRPIRYFAPIYGGLGMGLSICTLISIYIPCAFGLTILCSFHWFWYLCDRPRNSIG